MAEGKEGWERERVSEKLGREREREREMTEEREKRDRGRER